MSSSVNLKQPVSAAKTPMDATCIDTIRTLAMDAVQKANSGHPGTPMALAPVAYLLWQDHLRFDPSDPVWPNRDRFVLSCGHASMLLYSLLHLTEVQAVDENYETLGKPSVSLDEIKRFRQLHSHTPGHPEYHLTSGVETTTGPLGQGVANSVGMAIAERWLAAHFNKPGFEDLIDFNVYAICSDGDMMEGISHEAASLAGHLKLSNLCWIYDDNRITIEGSTELTYGDDVAERFMAYGWNVTRVGDANDLELLERAYQAFLNCNDRPTLIIVDSHIAWGAPNKQDTSGAHGEPLGEEEIRLTKKFYGWPEDAKFYIPDGVYEAQASIDDDGLIKDEEVPIHVKITIKGSDMTIDLSGYDVGESIHISNVKLPSGVESGIADRDFTIATIVAPSALKSSEGDAEAEGDATEGTAE